MKNSIFRKSSYVKSNFKKKKKKKGTRVPLKELESMELKFHVKFLTLLNFLTLLDFFKN